MGEHNLRLGQPFARRQSIENMVRQTDNNARKIDGLLGRDAFMPACHAYATSNPDVPDYLVRSHVAKILKPDLKFQKRRFCNDPNISN